MTMEGIVKREKLKGKGINLLSFFDSIYMGRCKIPSAMNDPDDIYILRFDLVENPV
jgi:hypothetical protein